LSGAIEARAGGIWRLTLGHLGRKSYSEAGAEGGNGCDGELHCGGWLVRLKSLDVETADLKMKIVWKRDCV